MPLGCVIYIPLLYHEDSPWCTPMWESVPWWLTFGIVWVVYIYAFGVGFSEVARFDDDGQFSGASGCEASDEQGFTSFLYIL